MDAIEQIAHGGDASWEGTFSHPEHGELTFRVPRTLTNSDWIRHTNAIDRIVRSHGGDPNDASARTTLFASACAGILELMERPVILEREIEDPENQDHVKIERVRYDPLLDENMNFPVQVWDAYFTWRNRLHERIGELGKDSGETHGSGSGEPSPAATGSPSMILG